MEQSYNNYNELIVCGSLGVTVNKDQELYEAN